MSVVEHLHKKYDGFELSIDCWQILDQGVTALWGPSGSGKTSIFRILSGLEACSGMRWLWGSEDLAQLPTPKKNLGVVFQSLDLFPHMTTRQNIFFAAKARKINKEAADKRFARMNEVLQMTNFLDRKAELLSGGEKQRAALARALMSFPRMLLLDEPFSALDESLRAEARILVQKILAETSTPALLITHDARDLEVLAQQVTKIENGRIQTVSSFDR
jgi:ABC-type Fe3+/spermidine/putrescine transport system ATPase subunit